MGWSLKSFDVPTNYTQITPLIICLNAHVSMHVTDQWELVSWSRACAGSQGTLETEGQTLSAWVLYEECPETAAPRERKIQLSPTRELHAQYTRRYRKVHM